MQHDEEADRIFDDFLSNRVAQGALFADFVALLNMKANENIDNDIKMEVLTEILNDVKLFMLNAQSTEH
tara:strand:+ start:354 stop:560 length:207 start_codon:yes stop_codon:yes gene_type:complete